MLGNFYVIISTIVLALLIELHKKETCLKKNHNTPRPSAHPPVMGEKMSKRLGGINVVVSHIQRIGCQPEKNCFTRWSIPLVVC